MKLMRVLILTTFVFLHSLILPEKSFGNGCSDIVIECTAMNPYEPGSNAWLVFNQGCFAAGIACELQQA